ncbi:hypothetical protein [Paenibacillus sp. Marseille-Q4541]|uniref:hypothetical protein n=1 Tax=Paenibacillus sp. Marseille-Q4541 TaxID=2831522 RepID=UPI001BAAB7D3|nr:hypothetical protein [Paenibacillus sp. Marseille-Q4541]
MEENNIVVAVFNDDSKAYQVLSESKLKKHDQYQIMEAAVIKKENGNIVFKDGYSPRTTTDTTAFKSGLIGSIIGILGGPIGILLGGSIGSMIGATKIVNRQREGFSLIERTVEELYNGETAFVANVQENNEIAFNHFLQQYDPKFVYRKEVSLMETEMNKAREMEQELAREEEERRREERSEDRHEKAEEMKERIKSEFQRIKEKLTEK